MKKEKVILVFIKYDLIASKYDINTLLVLKKIDSLREEIFFPICFSLFSYPFVMYFKNIQFNNASISLTPGPLGDGKQKIYLLKLIYIPMVRVIEEITQYFKNSV